jgi:putative transposase
MVKRLAEYCNYFNSARPHQGIGQKVPLGTRFSADIDGERIVSIPILGGLHHEYKKAA